MNEHELSPEARAVLEGGADIAGPTDAQRKRMGAAVLGAAGLAAAPATAAAATATTASVSGVTASGIAVKLVVAVAIVGGAATVGWRVTHRAPDSDARTHEHAHLQVHAQPPREVPRAATEVVAPDEAQAVPVVEPAAPERLSTTGHARRAAPSSSAAPSTTTDADSLRAEISLIRGAQNALREHQPAAALHAVDEHERRFPHGALREEGLVTRIIALCDLGRVADARAIASRLVRESPHAAGMARVRASCAGQVGQASAPANIDEPNRPR